jgi:DNA-binding protein Fis
LLKKVKTEFRNSSILELDISKDIDLNKVLYEIEQDLIEKAWVYSGQRKQKTADLLGFKNYQTLTPRLKKYGLE